jgi:tRNA modification GTPase
LNRQDKQIQRQLFDKKYIIVINKNDLVSKVAIKGIRVSAKLNKIDNLIDSLIRKLQTEINIDYNDIVLQSTTSIGYMQQIVEEFKNIKILINKKQPLDLTMQHLHEALINIDSILGKGKEYNFYNELFRKFCVGK